MSSARLPFTCCLVVVAILASSTVSLAFAQIGIGQGLRVDRPARSIKALRDENLVKQRLDFSCGAAALATMLRYGFGEAVTEREILTQLFDLLSDEEKTSVRKTGFSLLHLPFPPASSGPAS
jgi:predicted double-glycine peptidase